MGWTARPRIETSVGRRLLHNIAAEGPPRRLQASLRLISIVLPEEQQAALHRRQIHRRPKASPLKADLIKPPKRDGSLSQQPMPGTGQRLAGELSSRCSARLSSTDGNLGLPCFLFAAACHAGWNALIKIDLDPLPATTLITVGSAVVGFVVSAFLVRTGLRQAQRL